MTVYDYSLDTDKFLADLRFMTKPLFVNNDGKKSMMATAFLCSYRGKAYIVSAGHVVSNNFNLQYFVHIDNNLCINLNKFKYIDNNKNDILISEILHNELSLFSNSDSNFFNIDTNFQYNLDIFDSFIFCGYPASKFNAYKNPQTASFISCRAHALHNPYHITFNKKVDENYHIVAELSSQNVTVITGDSKKIQKLPKLNGLSGGPVFGLLNGNPRPYFVGIGIKKLDNQRYLVGLKNSIIVKSIEEYHLNP